MYTQALNTSEAEVVHVEDAQRAAHFQARIDADDRIEANDWMATGSPAPQRFVARPRCSPRFRTSAATACISTPQLKPSVHRAKSFMTRC